MSTYHGTQAPVAFAGLALLAAAATAPAQKMYPVRPVRVAFAPEGGTAIIARSLSAQLTHSFGQQVVVDNRLRGRRHYRYRTGRACSRTVTTCSWCRSFAANPVLRKTTYDPINGFGPVSLLSR